MYRLSLPFLPSTHVWRGTRANSPAPQNLSTHLPKQHVYELNNPPTHPPTQPPTQTGKHVMLALGNFLLALGMVGLSLLRYKLWHFSMFSLHIIGYAISDTALASLISRYVFFPPSSHSLSSSFHPRKHTSTTETFLPLSIYTSQSSTHTHLPIPGTRSPSTKAATWASITPPSPAPASSPPWSPASSTSGPRNQVRPLLLLSLSIPPPPPPVPCSTKPSVLHPFLLCVSTTPPPPHTHTQKPLSLQHKAICLPRFSTIHPPTHPTHPLQTTRCRPGPCPTLPGRPSLCWGSWSPPSCTSRASSGRRR